MEFYEALSAVYDKVFIYNENITNFIENKVEKQGVLLDLACGSGSYDLELNARGFKVHGIDLDKSMIDICLNKSQGNNVKFTCDDMTNIDKYYEKKSVNGIICIGNSLVHLENKNQIENFITKCYETLEPGGKFIVQIINYDNIIKNNIKSLPTIENEDIKFVRKYEYDKDKELIYFNTELYVKDEVYINSIPLKPIFKDELETMLNKAKFKQINFYGDFKENKYTEGSYALVVCAEK